MRLRRMFIRAMTRSLAPRNSFRKSRGSWSRRFASKSSYSMQKILKICSLLRALSASLYCVSYHWCEDRDWRIIVEFSERFPRFTRDFREQKMGRLKGQAVPSSAATCKGYQEHLSAYLHSWVFEVWIRTVGFTRPLVYSEIWSEALDSFESLPLDQSNGPD
jgi:hypothetical protein